MKRRRICLPGFCVHKLKDYCIRKSVRCQRNNASMSGLCFKIIGLEVDQWTSFQLRHCNDTCIWQLNGKIGCIFLQSPPCRDNVALQKQQTTSTIPAGHFLCFSCQPCLWVECQQWIIYKNVAIRYFQISFNSWVAALRSDFVSKCMIFHTGHSSPKVHPNLWLNLQFQDR